MSRVSIFLTFVLAGLLCLSLLLFRGVQLRSAADEQSVPLKRELVRRLGLTDLSLWSEARYTRHPSQADLFTAFQDYPGAFDHFPAGSIVGPGEQFRATRLEIHKKGAR